MVKLYASTLAYGEMLLNAIAEKSSIELQTAHLPEFIGKLSLWIGLNDLADPGRSVVCENLFVAFLEV
jgi:hypothetical protein